MQKVSEQRSESKSDIERWLADHVTAVPAYIDSLWMFARRLPRGFRTAIEAHGGTLWVTPCKDRSGNTVGYWLTVHQPTVAVLAHLDRLLHASLFRFDLAADFLTLRAADAEWLGHWLASHLLLRWRRKGPMHDEDCTLYWSKPRKRRRRNVVVYADRLSKLGESHCTHLELRFLTAQACRRQGVHHARDLRRLKPAQAFAHHLRISFAAEAYVQKAIRDAIKQDVQQHRGTVSSALEDKRRARLRYRAANMLKRLGHGRAQWVKDKYPKRVRTTLSPAILSSQHSSPGAVATPTPMVTTTFTPLFPENPSKSMPAPSSTLPMCLDEKAPKNPPSFV
jgi:hypothetical protein